MKTIAVIALTYFQNYSIMIVAEQILFTNNNGEMSSLEDIIADGLDGEYKDRIPALLELLESNSPYHQLMSCIVLMSWGHPAGFKTLIKWASDPNNVPWGQEPVSVDRISGVDSAFENLADALKTSYWNDETDELKEMQREVIEALLKIYCSHFFGQTLALALLKDPIWKFSRQKRIVDTLESCIQIIESGKNLNFDLPYQTACLLLVLARSNDSLTAEFAERLIKQYPKNNRMLRELIQALGEGSGQSTLQILNKLKHTSIPTLTTEINKVLSLRQGRI